MLDRIMGNIFTVIGVGFVSVALFLCLENVHEEKVALSSSENALFFITTHIGESEFNSDILVEEYVDDFELSMVEPLMIDGNLYAGMLDIPDLQLQLPIQSEWSYPKLKISPCIYKEEPFSILAHNYNAHFAKIGTLKIGAEVSYITINGYKTDYKVVSIEQINEKDVEKLNDLSYDLSLVTCNYDNNTQRIVVRLVKK
ncbi:MAG: sortase [Clostridia bacterium]